MAPGAEIRTVSWPGDDTPPRPPATQRPRWQPSAPMAPTVAAPAAAPSSTPLGLAPVAAPAPEPTPAPGRDVALAVHIDGAELVILLGALAGLDDAAHIRVQDAALEAARVARTVVPTKARGAVRLVATRDHVIVRVELRSHLACARDVARELLAGWKAGAL